MKTVLFQIIQFSISHLFAKSNRSIWPIDRTLWGATTLSQSRPGRDTLHSPKLQHCWTEASPLDFFSVISRTLMGGGVLPLCRDAVCVLYSPSSWLVFFELGDFRNTLDKLLLKQNSFNFLNSKTFITIYNNQHREDWGFCLMAYQPSRIN